MRRYLVITVILSLWYLECLESAITVDSSKVKLEANVSLLNDGNRTTAFFYCKAGQGQLFYLNHVLTWSKIGRDGRERYLSINWDLVQHGTNMGYHVETRMQNVTLAAIQRNKINEPVMFILWKKDLLPSDHGEYVCRLHDFDRNLIAEASVPTTVFENGLAMSPYRVEVSAGEDVNVTCMQKIESKTKTSGGHIVMSHVAYDGTSTRLVKGGKLVSKQLSGKYRFTTTDVKNIVKYNTLTLFNTSKTDEGYIVCEMKKKKIAISSTNATISVDGPRLQVSPLYYLKVPHDADAHFKCECGAANTRACKNNNMKWVLSNQTSGEITNIYTDGRLVGDPKLYEIVHEDNTSTNLTIHGVKTGVTEGDFVCSLHDHVTGVELSHASLPVSVVPVSLRAMAMMEKVNNDNNVRLLCILSGTTWDTHYFETHNIAWIRHRDGRREQISANGVLGPSIDPSRYILQFDNKHNYSIITIKAISKLDHGDYSCQLQNTYTNSVVLNQNLAMYGRGNTTAFGV